MGIPQVTFELRQLQVGIVARAALGALVCQFAPRPAEAVAVGGLPGGVDPNFVNSRIACRTSAVQFSWKLKWRRRTVGWTTGSAKRTSLKRYHSSIAGRNSQPYSSPFDLRRLGPPPPEEGR